MVHTWNSNTWWGEVGRPGIQSQPQLPWDPIKTQNRGQGWKRVRRGHVRTKEKVVNIFIALFHGPASWVMTFTIQQATRLPKLILHGLFSPGSLWLCELLCNKWNEPQNPAPVLDPSHHHTQQYWFPSPQVQKCHWLWSSPMEEKKDAIPESGWHTATSKPDCSGRDSWCRSKLLLIWVHTTHWVRWEELRTPNAQNTHDGCQARQPLTEPKAPWPDTVKWSKTPST